MMQKECMITKEKKLLDPANQWDLMSYLVPTGKCKVEGADHLPGKANMTVPSDRQAPQKVHIG